MSTEEAPLSRAEKKAQRDAARHKKTSKKRTIAEVGDGDDEPVAQQDDEGTAVNATADANSEVIASSKKSKKAKEPRPSSEAKIPGESRSERRERKSLDATTTTAPTDAATNSETPSKTPSKRRKKNDGTSTTTDADTADPTAKPSKSRFILFIGNLPFKATDAGLQAHFAKLQPFTLRHRVDPQTKKSKGFAFLEFENYDRMKTCLKLYHHSEFDADAVTNGGTGKTNAKNVRKINVELTAGGGGKAEGRKEKIKVKNVRLEEQRKRRAEVERKEKERKDRKEGGAKAKKGDGEEPAATGGEKEPAVAVDLGGMHPSRMARLNG
jgi:nucleolar protein 6